MPHAVVLPEYVGDFPNFCGSEEVLRRGSRRAEPIYLPDSAIDFDQITINTGRATLAGSDDNCRFWDDSAGASVVVSDEEFRFVTIGIINSQNETGIRHPVC